LVFLIKMRVVLKKNQMFDDIDYIKNDVFVLEAIKWSDDGNFKYLLSYKEKRHIVDANLFDVDGRDIK
ncbi:hypothetical protein EB151_11635, partial [archaeon]|nr:hypothetical protein [archaeon]